MGFGLPFKITTLLSAKLKELTVLNLNLIHSTDFCFPILRRLKPCGAGLNRSELAVPLAYVYEAPSIFCITVCSVYTFSVY
jgi:hypothetical protein